jgi:hypothetical protein
MNKIILLILSAIFGLFFLAFGVYGVVMEFKVPPMHPTHLFVFCFFILLGASLFPWIGAVIFGRIKDGLALAGPYIPTFGRRASQGEIAVTPPPKPPDAEGP